MVAQLGGSVNRKRDDEPGPQTVGLGLQRLHDIALCWQVIGPGAPAKDATAGVEGVLVYNNEGDRPRAARRAGPPAGA